MTMAWLCTSDCVVCIGCVLGVSRSRSIDRFWQAISVRDMLSSPRILFSERPHSNFNFSGGSDDNNTVDSAF
jgi:hypothetical protein